MYADSAERGRYTVWQNVNAFINATSDANVIMVTAVDTFARRNEGLEDDVIQDEAMSVLREMYGDSVPEPLDIVVPRWHSDPLFRGSYSNWPLGVLDEHHANLGQPVKKGDAWIHFAGEATSYDMFGYVNGAWDSGINVANAIGQCINKGDCPDAKIYDALKTCPQESSMRRRDVAGRAPRRHHRGPRGAVQSGK